MKKYYDKGNKRLVYIEESATPDFWDEHWETENFKETIKRGKNNRFVLKTLNKYIPDKKGRSWRVDVVEVRWFIVCMCMDMKA